MGIIWTNSDWGVKSSKAKGGIYYVDDMMQEIFKAVIVGVGERDAGAFDVLMVGSNTRVEFVVMQTAWQLVVMYC